MHKPGVGFQCGDDLTTTHNAEIITAQRQTNTYPAFKP